MSNCVLKSDLNSLSKKLFVLFSYLVLCSKLIWIIKFCAFSWKTKSFWKGSLKAVPAINSNMSLSQLAFLSHCLASHTNTLGTLYYLCLTCRVCPPLDLSLSKVATVAVWSGMKTTADLGKDFWFQMGLKGPYQFIFDFSALPITRDRPCLLQMLLLTFDCVFTSVDLRLLF